MESPTLFNASDAILTMATGILAWAALRLIRAVDLVVKQINSLDDRVLQLEATVRNGLSTTVFDVEKDVKDLQRMMIDIVTHGTFRKKTIPQDPPNA